MRPPDWPERLARLLDDWQGRDFVWGQGDCVQFARAVVTAVTGRALKVPRYRAREVRRLLQQQDLAARVAATLGTPAAPALAQRGDVVLQGGALGVCLGASVALRAPQRGLVICPLDHTALCWPL